MDSFCDVEPKPDKPGCTQPTDAAAFKLLQSLQANSNAQTRLYIDGSDGWFVVEVIDAWTDWQPMTFRERSLHAVLEYACNHRDILVSASQTTGVDTRANQASRSTRVMPGLKQVGPEKLKPAEKSTREELALDVDEARAIHRCIRAIHDGECPRCHKLHSSEAMRAGVCRPVVEMPGVTRSDLCWKCPSCHLTLTVDEIEAGLAEFAPFMDKNYQVFDRWLQAYRKRRAAGQTTLPAKNPEMMPQEKPPAKDTGPYANLSIEELRRRMETIAAGTKLVVAQLTDGMRWNWTRTLTERQAACAVLKLMHSAGILKHATVDGRDCWIVDGCEFSGPMTDVPTRS